MILTKEQKANIGVLVSNEVEYHETYQEVYDHVITSLEEKQDLADLQRAYGNILEDDFGGHYGIKMLEENRRRIVRKETFQKQKDQLYWFFKLPGLLVLITFCSIYGYFYEHQLLNINSVFSGSFILLTISSFIIMSISNFILRKKNRNRKPSINNASIKIMWRITWKGYIYLVLFRVLCSFLYIQTSSIFKADYHRVFINIAATIIDFASFVLALYLIAGLIVYKNEFKKRLAI
ncbi:hypothetical protein KXQ82_13975 [Mucilaginibacter sp. HMF5004]|uniref:hypothetical protein n=1 Tax=Mucilaginibacter rivuli TaxID=2857527 RepID=UPI001C5F00A9|nr:hypothetical protein [Mucilaginibacter rivuli]MBW4890835.1 hypothetical protein [Mucilaginibacter rivuli]